MSLELTELINPESVRRALDLGLSAEALPNAAITDDIFARTARRELLGIYADAESEDVGTENGKAVANAMNFLVASIILPSLPQLTAQKAADESYNRQFGDVDAGVARLKSLAFAELSVVIGETATAFTPIFGLLHGTRGL